MGVAQNLSHWLTVSSYCLVSDYVSVMHTLRYKGPHTLKVLKYKHVWFKHKFIKKSTQVNIQFFFSLQTPLSWCIKIYAFAA